MGAGRGFLVRCRIDIENQAITFETLKKLERFRRKLKSAEMKRKMTRKSSVVTRDKDDEVEGTFEKDSWEEIQIENEKEERRLERHECCRHEEEEERISE